MDDLWTDEQKADARVIDKIVEEAMKEGPPRWHKILWHYFKRFALAAFILYLGCVAIPNEIPLRKMHRKKWTRLTLNHAMCELHYHDEVVRRLGRPLKPEPIPVMVPRHGSVVPTVIVPLGQYIDKDGYRHHQVEFIVAGPRGQARVWVDRLYQFELPLRRYLFPKWHFFFVDFGDEKLNLALPPGQEAAPGISAPIQRRWWQF